MPAALARLDSLDGGKPSHTAVLLFGTKPPSDASVQVMLLADRLEVWNPGRLPATLSHEQFTRLHASIPRNPFLAEPMFLARTSKSQRAESSTRSQCAARPASQRRSLGRRAASWPRH